MPKPKAPLSQRPQLRNLFLLHFHSSIIKFQSALAEESFFFCPKYRIFVAFCNVIAEVRLLCGVLRLFFF